jgi:acetoin utilization deacetylase AcuC-like enzyme
LILYDTHLKHGFTDFGIEIPVKDSRASRTFKELSAHPRLGRAVSSWHLFPSEETATRADLLRVHSARYVDRLFSEALEAEIIRTYELIDRDGKYFRYHPERAHLPLTQLFDQILRKVSGTIESGRLALEKGFCFHFGGGMHHAQKDFGNGFCLLNDIVIALRRLRSEGRIHQAWVIDVDAHKGDGTAALTREDASITTLSIHMARGWPLDGPRYDDRGRLNPSFLPSDIDIGVDAGGESQYLPGLEKGLRTLTTLSRPDLALVVSGADPYEHDELPSTRSLNLSLEQMMERDKMVFRFLESRGIPAAYLMAGGYGDRSWEVYYQFLEWVLERRLGRPAPA